MLEAINAGYRIGQTWLLRAFDLDIGLGEFCAIVGPNGAGKTTALRLLGGEAEPSEGTVRFFGTSISEQRPETLAKKRACFAQQNDSAFPFTVRELVALGRMPHNPRFRESPRDSGVINSAMETAGIDHLAARSVPTLSGGEATRAHFARALTQEPALLLLDEPTNHLDIRHQYEVLQACKHRTNHGCAVVAVLHDLNLAAHFADRIAMLSEGRLAAFGPPNAVLTSDLIEDVYGIPCTIWQHPSGCPWIVPTMKAYTADQLNRVSA